MPGGSVHGREPEPLDEILDCLAYAQAVHAGDDESSLATYDVLHFRFAGVLEGVRTWVLAERDHCSR